MEEQARALRGRQKCRENSSRGWQSGELDLGDSRTDVGQEDEEGKKRAPAEVRQVTTYMTG